MSDKFLAVLRDKRDEFRRMAFPPLCQKVLAEVGFCCLERAAFGYTFWVESRTSGTPLLNPKLSAEYHAEVVRFLQASLGTGVTVELCAPDGLLRVCWDYTALEPAGKE